MPLLLLNGHSVRVICDSGKTDSAFCQYAVHPPSAVITAPFTKPDASDARNKATSATSTGFDDRGFSTMPGMILSFTKGCRFLRSIVAAMFVSIAPGAMALHLMPDFAYR